MLSWWYIASIAIVVIGVLIFFYLAGKKSYRDKSAAENYTRIRNKLTIRKPKEKKASIQDKLEWSFPSLGNIIGGFIVILIGTSLIGPVSKQVNLAQEASSSMNISSEYTETLAGMLTLFFTWAVATAAIGIVYSSLRSSGEV